MVFPIGAGRFRDGRVLVTEARGCHGDETIGSSVVVVVVVVVFVVGGGEVSDGLSAVGAVGATLVFVVVGYPLSLAGEQVSEVVTAAFLFKHKQN